jgi:hypothetical protein
MARRRHRGRPRKAQAKRRATTTAERRPLADHGSPELQRRKLTVANGSPVPVELVDISGILLAHSLITPEEMVVLRLLADWLRQLRRGLGLSQASPGGLWAAITSRTAIGSAAMPAPFGGDRALFRLIELHAHFDALGRPELLALVMRVAAAETAPANARTLDLVREGLRIIGDLIRRGRRGRARRPPVESPPRARPDAQPV